MANNIGYDSLAHYKIIVDTRMFPRIHRRLYETGSLGIDNSSKGAHRTGIFHNNHVWSKENAYPITEGHHQEQFSVKQLAGRKDELSYRHFLENDLPILLGDVLLLSREKM